MSKVTTMVLPRSRSDIERKTEMFLREVDPVHLKMPKKLDIMSILEIDLMDLGLFVEIVPELHGNREACLVPDDRKILIPRRIHESAMDDNPRARFTVAHEIYHAIDHFKQFTKFNLARKKYVDKLEFKVYMDPEWQANWGGAALLMPRKTIIPFFNGLQRRGMGINEIIEEIQKVYVVSRIAARKRLEKLELIEKDS